MSMDADLNTYPVLILPASNCNVLHFTNFLTVHQKNLYQMYIINGVLSDFKSFLWVSQDHALSQPLWIAARYVVTVKSKKECRNCPVIPML